MARAYHVDGPVVVSVGFAGVDGAFSALGIVEAGVEAAIDHKIREVKTDVAGEMVPAELQDMGKTADIPLDLVDYDDAIVNQVKAIGDQTGSTIGASPSRGLLLGTAGKTFVLKLVGPTKTVIFPTCVLKGPYSDLKSTKNNVQKLKVFAWEFIPAGANSAKDAVLYTEA